MTKELKEITTKTGFIIKESWCRKCSCMKPATSFYETVDAGFIDTNGLMSVCKDCVQKIYDDTYDETKSLEKSIHKMCVSLNIKFSNEAVAATRSHIETLISNGKQVHAIFSIYKMKLTATKKSMDKSGLESMTYEDIGTIYVSEDIEIDEIPIPQTVIDFWGSDVEREDIIFLENEYLELKKTHSAESRAEVILLKMVCFALLKEKQLRQRDEDTGDTVKEIQALMKTLAVSPDKINSSGLSKGESSFGQWIEDIEKYEPCQWLAEDPRGDMYRDVADVDLYFKQYVVRPLKNFVMGSKDFHVEEEREDDDFEYDDDENINYNLKEEDGSEEGN